MAAHNITAVRILESKRLLTNVLDLLDELYMLDELDSKHSKWISDLTDIIVVPLNYENQYVTSQMEELYLDIKSAWESEKKELLSLLPKITTESAKPIEELPLINNDIPLNQIVNVRPLNDDDDEWVENLIERDELIRNTEVLIDALRKDQTNRFTREERDELIDVLQREILDELRRHVFENAQDDMIDLYNAIVNLYNGDSIEREGEDETMQELIARAFAKEHDGMEMTKDEVRELMQSRSPLMRKMKTPKPKKKKEKKKKTFTPPIPTQKEVDDIGRQVLAEGDIWNELDNFIEGDLDESELRRQRNELETALASERGQYNLQELGEEVWDETGYDIDNILDQQIEEGIVNQEQLRLENILRDRQRDRQEDFNQIGNDVLLEQGIGEEGDEYFNQLGEDVLLEHGIGEQDEVEELEREPVSDVGSIREDIDMLNIMMDAQQEMLDRAQLLRLEGMNVGRRAQDLVNEYENVNIEMSNAGRTLSNTEELLDGLNIENINDEHTRLRHELNTVLDAEVNPEELREEVERLRREIEAQHTIINELGQNVIQGVNANERVYENAQDVEGEILRDVRHDAPVDLQQMLEALMGEVEEMEHVSNITSRNEPEQYAKYLQLQERIEELIQQLQENIDDREQEREGVRIAAEQKNIERNVEQQDEPDLLNDILDLENENLMRARNRDRDRDREIEREARDVRESREAAYLRELLEQMQDQWVNEDDDMYDTDDMDGGDDDDDGEIPEDYRLTRENIRRYYTLDQYREGGFPGRFGEQTTLFGIRVLPLDDLLLYHDGETVFAYIMEDAIHRFLPLPGDRRPQDLIHVHISHNRLRHGDINQLRRVQNWNIDAVVNNIGAILQSNEDWMLGVGGPDDGFNIDLMYIRRPGVGGMLPGQINMDSYLKKSKSFLQVKDPGVYCGPIAIALALAHAKKDKDKDAFMFYKKMIAVGNKNVRKNVAIQLLNVSRVDIPTLIESGGSTLKDMEKMDEYVQTKYKGNYHVVVYSYAHHNEVIYRKKPEGNTKSIALNVYLYNNHYGVITKLESFFGDGYTCPECNQHFKKKITHKCTRVCPGCKIGKCELSSSREHIKCDLCNRWLMSQACFVKHLALNKDGKSTCNTFKKCKKCPLILRSFEDEHECGKIRCKQCHLKMELHEMNSHACYMRPVKNEATTVAEDWEKGENVNEEKCTKKRKRKKKVTDDEIPTIDEDVESVQHCYKFLKEVWKHYNLPGPYRSSVCSDYVYSCIEDLDKGYHVLKDKIGSKGKPREIAVLEEFNTFLKYLLKAKCIGTYIFYDFECRQDEPVDIDMIRQAKKVDGGGPVLKDDDDEEDGRILHKHIANLVVAHRVCDFCWKKPDMHCLLCKQREWVWAMDRCDIPFCEWMFEDKSRERLGKSPNHDRTAIAHNFKGYDGMIIKSYLFECGVSIDSIESGSKLMRLKYKSVLFIDSLNFLPMSLSKMGKTFELKVKKGDFPHFFNTKENQFYMGRIPDPKFYGLGYKKSQKDVDDFMEWYQKSDEEHGLNWNFAKEMLEYCRNDVEVLMQGAMTFKKMYFDVTGVDPFSCVTIAGACMKTYRSNNLEEHVIPIIPPQGYDPTFSSRLEGLIWLFSELQGHDDDFKYSYKRDEIRLGETASAYATGLGSDGKVYVYHPCVWHGCPQCFPNRFTQIPFKSYNVEVAYQKTLKNNMEIKDYLEEKGLNVETHLVEVWEHEIDVDNSEEIEDALIEKHPCLIGSLKPRNAFYGGRTGPCRLQCKTNDNEKIMYYDVCSLYPWVNKTCKYPVGHPEVIKPGHELYDTKNVYKYEGLVWCEVIPPRRLFHPLLPYRCNKKLLFGLCRTCMETSQHVKCIHNDDERCITGTWTTMELQKAVTLGYSVRKIYEAWHFNETKGGTYVEEEQATTEEKEEKRKRRKSLFEDYIKGFLKVKQEASGWPPDLEDDSQADIRVRRQMYIDNYFKHEGVRLNYCNIKKNPGMRAVAKLCLNSLWGKLGQRSNIVNKSYFCEPNTFYEFLNNRTQVVTDLELLTPDIMCVHSHPNEEFETAFCNTNVVMAAYTTSHARLKLYSYLELLSEKVLYYDTDSVFFVQRNDVPCPLHTGNYLGDLTDEIVGDYGQGAYISEFYAGGPKNYAYKVVIPGKPDEFVLKVRGITLNMDNQKKLNFETLKTMVLGDMDRCVLTDEHKIERNKHVGLVSCKQDKEYRVLSTKRVLVSALGNGWTLPYGY